VLSLHKTFISHSRAIRPFVQETRHHGDPLPRGNPPPPSLHSAAPFSLSLSPPPPSLSLSLSLSLSRSSIRRRCYVAVRLVIVIVACSPLNRSPKFESSRTFHVLRFLSASLRFDEALRDLCREQRVAYDLAQSITIRPPIERPEKSGCRV